MGLVILPSKLKNTEDLCNREWAAGNPDFTHPPSIQPSTAGEEGDALRINQRTDNGNSAPDVGRFEQQSDRV